MMIEASNEFRQTATQLISSYSGVAQAAQIAIDHLQTSIDKASATAQGATRELLQKFNKFQAWTVAALCVAAFSTGLALGVVIDQGMRPIAPVATPVQQAGPAIPGTPGKAPGSESRP